MHGVCEKTKEATENQEEHESCEKSTAKKEPEEKKGKRFQNAAGVDFADLLLENAHLKRPRRWADVLVSLGGQVAFVIILLLVPLYYTHGLDLPKFEKTMLASPPPPPPPPPSRAVHVMPRPKATLFDNNHLIAPRAIPKHIEMVKEETPPSPGLQGVTGGVPGGVPGGTVGGVLGGVLSAASGVPAPPPKPVVRGPLRVGGQIQAPRLIREVQPEYPPLAKQTRTQGEVVLDCVIDAEGNVTQMRLISGHPLLVGAAMNAVRQWRYQPTLLNGKPVAVEMMVHVKFSLGGY